MNNNENSSTLRDEIVFGENGKNLLAWLSQQESEMKDDGTELIKNGDVAGGTNKILTSVGVGEIISTIESMRRGLDDREKNRPKKKSE